MATSVNAAIQSAGNDQESSRGTMTFYCTTCPYECLLTVEVEQSADGDMQRAVRIAGNRCPRGAAFAEQEITRPQRILTSTVVVRGGDEALLPVRTTAPFDRNLHMQAMEQIRNVAVAAPVRMGDIVIPNLLNTGVDLVASLDIETKVQ